MFDIAQLVTYITGAEIIVGLELNNPENIWKFKAAHSLIVCCVWLTLNRARQSFFVKISNFMVNSAHS